MGALTLAEIFQFRISQSQLCQKIYVQDILFKVYMSNLCYTRTVVCIEESDNDTIFTISLHAVSIQRIWSFIHFMWTDPFVVQDVYCLLYKYPHLEVV